MVDVTDEELLGGDPKVGIKEIAAGSAPQLVNRQHECPTIYVDGLYGISISTHVTKFGLIEHIAGPDELMGRFVATVVIPNDQFQKVVAALKQIADTVTPPGAAE